MKDGGSAFPSTRYWDSRYESYSPPETDGGMTLRDYFAAAAMQGILASEPTPSVFNNISQVSYAIAEAMLKERSK